MRLRKKLKLSAEEGKWASIGKKEIERTAAMDKELTTSSKDSIPWEEIAASRIEKYTEPGLAIRGARIKEKLTLAQLAYKSKIPTAILKKMENGKYAIDTASAKRLGKILKVDYRVMKKKSKKALGNMPIGKLTRVNLNLPQKLDFGDKSKIKLRTSNQCIFRQIGHSESEAFSLRFKSKLISNLRDLLNDPVLAKIYQLKKLDLKKQDFKNISDGNISKLSLDTLLFMFCVLGGTIDLNPPKPLQLKKLRGIMKKAQSQFSRKNEDLSLGEMLVAAMEEAVQVAENQSELPKKFRIVKMKLPSPKALRRSIATKQRKK